MEKRIKALEKRIEELERRPVYIPQPYPYYCPQQPMQPSFPPNYVPWNDGPTSAGDNIDPCPQTII